MADKPPRPLDADAAPWASLLHSGLPLLCHYAYNAGCTLLLLLCLWFATKFLRQLIFFLDQDEQVVVVRLSDTEVCAAERERRRATPPPTPSFSPSPAHRSTTARR